ncbi:inovirus Gp2 family protein, partial [Escherichia coli]|nr:inovirus Gp2 family protein [Escherichia coli]
VPVRPAVWLELDDDAGVRGMLKRADYLAKEYTTVNGTGGRNFGCSRG